MIYSTGWFIRKDDKNGNIEMKNKWNGEVIKQINGGAFDHHTIIHVKQDGTFFVKETDLLDAAMYLACHRDGEPYTNEWREESEEKYGQLTLGELILAFHEAGTPEQTKGLIDVLDS
ncbi:hypothetical protein IMZ31_24015 (plasmid) [Pontibacillus sp. ALD_SL1]|uniref:hypothetical protein n=1 Tax=Pontibacillus sp. ALD_SL1 TaxID=2777185 RepID=UPI001A9577BD|nr:hypothetical protein [Pontibacillus sp. ALD_SL1]QST02519.1 hypothetical protein IMZ31_24015 [Pontibacillus sp. ALD_SL1]